MKALVVRQLGNPVPSPTEKKPYAVIADHPSPQYLAPNAVRIRIAASGLNFADALQVMVRRRRGCISLSSALGWQGWAPTQPSNL